MKLGLFVYGGLLSPRAQESELGKVPPQKEIRLDGWARRWCLSLPPGFKILDEHSYIPENIPDDHYPTYLSLARDPNSYTVGKLVEVSEPQLAKFDLFEGVDKGVMERREIEPHGFERAFVYVGGKKFLEYFEDACKQGLACIPGVILKLLLGHNDI